MITPSAEIEQLIRRWYQRIEAGEMVSAATDLLSCDAAFRAIGTDKDEWFAHRAGLITAYGKAAEAGPPQIEVERIDAFSEGPVGWAVDEVLVARPGTQPILMRHTFILRREEGVWKVIHGHYSLPAPDGT